MADAGFFSNLVVTDLPKLTLFQWGLLGGLLPEVAFFYKNRQKSVRHLATIGYWLKTVPMILSGGFIVAMYVQSGISLAPVLAVNIGASAPLIIDNFLSSTPPMDPGKVNS